jgi:hypothetical protein
LERSGTQSVTTTGETMPLSRPGDIVISRNPNTREYEYRRVVDPLNLDSERAFGLPATDLAAACDCAKFALSGEQRVFAFDSDGQLFEYHPLNTN